jgi:hypothetical protein
MGALSELRAISEASSEELRYINHLHECANVMNEVHTGAIESIKHALSVNNQEAKDLMTQANSQIRDGKKAEAKKSLDKAIKILKENRKKAEEIDDDGLLEHLLISSLMSMIPGVGSIAYAIGYYAEWYALRDQSSKGDVYSKAHPGMRKNLAMEFFFGKLIAKGYSRNTVLAGYDKLIDECESIKRHID